MKSPFPGMDPYLELHWRDVHASLIYNARNAIQRQLGGSLRARIGERLIVEEEFEVKRSIAPDVQIFEYGIGGETAVLAEPSDVAVAEPIIFKSPPLEIRETFVQIIDPASGGRVITLLEFVSPANKIPGEGRRLYKEKQEETIAAGVNLVEIDLTRRGESVFKFRREALQGTHRTLYLAGVFRGFGAYRHEVYPIALGQRLPIIGIPLRKDDRDVVLDLQALITQAYEEGRYDDIDYHRPLDPPLAEELDRVWVAELLAAAGR